MVTKVFPGNSFYDFINNPRKNYVKGILKELDDGFPFSVVESGEWRDLFLIVATAASSPGPGGVLKKFVIHAEEELMKLAIIEIYIKMIGILPKDEVLPTPAGKTEIIAQVYLQVLQVELKTQLRSPCADLGHHGLARIL